MIGPFYFLSLHYDTFLGVFSGKEKIFLIIVWKEFFFKNIPLKMVQILCTIDFLVYFHTWFPIDRFQFLK